MKRHPSTISRRTPLTLTLSPRAGRANRFPASTSVALRRGQLRWIWHLGQLDEERVDGGLVHLHRRIVADGGELGFAGVFDVARLELRHDLLLRPLERHLARRATPVETDHVPAEARLHGLAQVAGIFQP